MHASGFKILLNLSNSKTDSLWCTYCKKSKHTKHTYFKLYGKDAVLSRKGGFRNAVQKSTQFENKEPNDALEKVACAISELGELSEDEISKLGCFLKTIQSDSCSIAQTGCLTSENVYASKNVDCGSWIIDSVPQTI